MHSSPVSSRLDHRDTLLCLHCSASSGRQWDRFAEALAADCDVLAPDLLGYASQGGWQGGAVTLADEADAVIALLDARADAVHVLGHSYGGAVALEVAMRRPDLVKSLTVFEPVRLALLGDASDASGDDPGVRDAGREMAYFAVVVQADVAAGALAAAAERFIDFWSAPGTWAQMSVSRRDAVAAAMVKVGAEFDAIFADAAPRSDYRRLTMPALLLGGSLSPAPMAVVLDRLHALLPRADRLRLEGVGHMGPVQAPARLASLLRGVVAGVRAADLAFSAASLPRRPLRLAA
jgi:pimeloyl-ACP methyl ester carboxylesterase